MLKIATKPSYQNIFKVSALVLMMIITLLSILAISGAAEAANLGDAFGDNSALKDAANKAGFAETTGEGDLNTIISRVIQTALAFMGIIFIILMLYGGYLWMSDQGNEEQVNKAKNIIIAAIIGAALIGSAYAISWFIVSVISGETLQERVAPDKTMEETVDDHIDSFEPERIPMELR